MDGILNAIEENKQLKNEWLDKNDNTSNELKDEIRLVSSNIIILDRNLVNTLNGSLEISSKRAS
jgi:hypothetical protein